MKLRRLTATFIIMALMMCCCIIPAGISVTAAAETATVAETYTEPTVSVSSASVEAGSTFTLNVELHNNPGIATMRLAISYDNTKLSLTSASDAGVLGSFSCSTSTSQPYILYWFNPAATSNYTVNGTIATLTFSVINDVKKGNTFPVSVSAISTNDILNKDVEPVEFDTVAGSVTITKSGSNDTPQAKYTYNFRNYTAYDYDEGGANGHRTLSYSGSQDFNGVSKYWWDKSSGISAYGALVGGSSVVNTGYGYSGNFGKISVRGDQGTAPTNYGGQAMTVKEGYTYTVTATYVPISMTGWYDTVDVGICLIVDDAVCSSRALNKVIHYSGDVARGGQFVTNPSNVVRYSQEAVTASDTGGTALTEAIATAVSAKTTSVTYTYDGSNSTDLGAHFGLMVGTGSAKLNCSADGDWKLSQVLVTDFEIIETKTSDAYTFTFDKENDTGTLVTSPDNLALMPTPANTENFQYWTTDNGGIYFAGEEVTLSNANTAFKAVYMTSAAEPMVSLRLPTADVTAGVRFRCTLPEETVMNAEEIGFAIIPTLAKPVNDWYNVETKPGGLTIFMKAYNFKNLYYAKVGSNYQYQVRISDLNNDRMLAANFAVVLYIKNADGTYTYQYIGCTSYNAVQGDN